jgi:hypothetical protein
MRWFFTDMPLDVSKHFEQNTELQSRTDWYASPVSPRCGIKLREGKLETKFLERDHGIHRLGDFRGRLESYKKWSLQFALDDQPGEEELSGAMWIAVEKRRRLQRFSVAADGVHSVDERPENGCEFEMTELTVHQQTFWTVGFEAVGEVESLPDNLLRVSQYVGNRGGLNQPFDEQHSCGYAEWLSRI